MTTALAVAGLALIVDCHQRAYQVPGTDGGGNDATDALAPLTLDISVTGCATFDVKAVNCAGPAPLEVSFQPVGTAALDTFRWTFGDGSPASMDRGPTHLYTLPGDYDVSVTGNGSVGSISTTRSDLITVTTVGAGNGCDLAAQCDIGLPCLCLPGSGCRPAFTRGICSTPCATGFCGAGAVCASTELGGAFDGGASPPQPYCLADCAGAACPAGYVCEQLPAGAVTSGWVEGCLPLGAARDFGASCRDANGLLQDDLCATGHCADVGALGLCSATCDATHACPAGGGCARVGGDQLCLPTCTAVACTDDPQLHCALGDPTDGGADGGFVLTAGDAGTSYCAP